jgi:hypothetical protein
VLLSHNSKNILEYSHKNLIALSLFACSLNVFAGAAVNFNCTGKNTASGAPVLYEATFADSAPEVGYTNQSVTVLKEGWEVLEKPLTFQMYGARTSNVCKKNENGEINMAGKTSFSMVPVKAGSVGDYAINFKIKCGSTVNYDVKDVCFFAH